MFVTLTLNPAVDCTLEVSDELSLNRVHSVVGETSTPGGKGINVAKAIAAAGGSVIAGGLVGEDCFSRFETFLQDAGIQTSFLAVPHPTRVNLMAVDADGRELKLNRPGFPSLDRDWPALSDYAESLCNRGDVFILSGSLPQRFPADTYGQLISLLKRHGKTVIVDTSGSALAAAVQARPDAIKPNRHELEALCRSAVASPEELTQAVVRVRADVRTVIVSDGPRRALFVDDSGALEAQPPELTVADSTGAGDALLGQFCADFFPDRRLTERVAARAVAAGSAASEQKGTPVVSLARVDALAHGARVTQCDDRFRAARTEPR